MKASDLRQAEVRDRTGRRIGVVVEVRARVEADQSLVVDGLVLGRRHFRLFGYERREERGPFLLEWIEALLYRHIRYASMPEVEIEAPGRVRLAVDYEDLPRMSEI
jgi:sporulation protein YlmC with PRC-barrel domain